MSRRWSGPARRAAKSVLTARDMRSRRLPSLRVEDRPAHTSTIYYLAPKPAKPAGGVRVIYRHVDVLNAMGRPALVVHPKPGDRCDWFDNDTAVTAATNVTVLSNDVLVVPEYYGPDLKQLPNGPSVVIFNQRAYHTFDRIPYESTDKGSPYAAIPRLRALLTVSDDNVRLLRHAFPSVAVHLADRSSIRPCFILPRPLAGASRLWLVGALRNAMHCSILSGPVAYWPDGTSRRSRDDPNSTRPRFSDLARFFLASASTRDLDCRRPRRWPAAHSSWATPAWLGETSLIPPTVRQSAMAIYWHTPKRWRRPSAGTNPIQHRSPHRESKRHMLSWPDTRLTIFGRISPPSTRP